MENLQEKAYFNIGNSEYYEGYYIKENRWNGWARPYFEKCIAELFVVCLNVFLRKQRKKL